VHINNSVNASTKFGEVGLPGWRGRTLFKE